MLIPETILTGSIKDYFSHPENVFQLAYIPQVLVSHFLKAKL